jgi:hypothetical protein
LQFLLASAHFVVAESATASTLAFIGEPHLRTKPQRHLVALRVHPERLERHMLIKVYSGTVSHSGRSLCETCRNATITRGQRLEDEIVRCEAQPMSHPVLIRFKVTECTAYIDTRLPTYAQLLEQAWILRPTSGRRPAGFVRSSDLRDDELGELMAELRESG